TTENTPPCDDGSPRVARPAPTRAVPRLSPDSRPWRGISHPSCGAQTTGGVRTTPPTFGSSMPPAIASFTAPAPLLGCVDGLSRVLGDGSARFYGEGMITRSSPYPTSYVVQSNTTSPDTRLKWCTLCETTARPWARAIPAIMVSTSPIG